MPAASGPTASTPTICIFARSRRRHGDAGNADKALPLLEEAIRLEPDYAVVHGSIAWCHEQRYLRGGLGAETREAACHHAHAAIEAGGDDAMALAMGGFVVGAMERDYETALEALDRSLSSALLRACVWLQLDHSRMAGRRCDCD